VKSRSSLRAERSNLNRLFEIEQEIASSSSTARGAVENSSQ
jgi:hypothetical protein